MAHVITSQGTPSGLLEESLLNTTESAALLGISKRTFQEQVAERKIAFIKFGRNIRFARADLEKFIAAHRSLPVGGRGGNRA